MMDDRNTLFSQQIFAGAIELIWREAELLDRKDYHAWLSLWDPAGFYVVPIDHDTTDGLVPRTIRTQAPGSQSADVNEIGIVYVDLIDIGVVGLHA